MMEANNVSHGASAGSLSRVIGKLDKRRSLNRFVPSHEI
jgi:hypothetical protein